VTENVDSLPDIAAEKSTLDRALGSFDEAQRRQKIHEAEKRKATRDMVTSLGRGKEVARQIRLAAKLRLGARNEKLALFNVAPLHQRRPQGRHPQSPGRAGGRGTPGGVQPANHRTNP